MNKNIKSILIIIAIVALFFAWDYYQKQKETNSLKAKIENIGCDLKIENYELGITKKEFKSKYFSVIDSLIYNKNTGYIDAGKIIKSFSGLKVKQAQFSFTKNVLCSIGFSLQNTTRDDVALIKNKFGKNNDWSTRTNVNEDGSIEYTYEYAFINDCVDITLIHHLHEQEIYINFEINDSIINGY